MENLRTFAKIVKNENDNYYKVMIISSYDTIFGHKEQTKNLPFEFNSLEVAKDFVSMLPEKMEEVTVKKHTCDVCHLCWMGYTTYKLQVGNYEVYIKWEANSLKASKKDEFVQRTKYYPERMLVRGFVSNIIIPKKIYGYSDIDFDNEYAKLTDLIKFLDAGTEEKRNNEHIFELVVS